MGRAARPGALLGLDTSQQRRILAVRIRPPGFSDLREGSHDVALVGGDTTSGPPHGQTVQILGHVPRGSGTYCASGARPGDHVFVSGTPGDARRGPSPWSRVASRPATDTVTYLRKTLPLPHAPAWHSASVCRGLCERLHRRLRRSARRCWQAGARERPVAWSSPTRKIPVSEGAGGGGSERTARQGSSRLTGRRRLRIVLLRLSPRARGRKLLQGAAAGTLGL